METDDNGFNQFMMALGVLRPRSMDRDQLIALISVILFEYADMDDEEAVDELVAEAILMAESSAAVLALNASVSARDGVH